MNHLERMQKRLAEYRESPRARMRALAAQQPALIEVPVIGQAEFVKSAAMRHRESRKGIPNTPHRAPKENYFTDFTERQENIEYNPQFEKLTPVPASPHRRSILAMVERGATEQEIVSHLMRAGLTPGDALTVLHEEGIHFPHA